MGRHDRDLPVEWIDGSGTDEVVPRSPSVRRWRGWYALLLIGVTVAIVAVSLGSGRGHRPIGSPAPTVAGTTVAPMILPVETTDVGRPLLAVPATWELFGRGHDLVRIQLRGGRITRTALPGLQSTGPVSFLVGPDWAIIRPLDFVPGYAVSDGHPPALLSGLLATSGPALPGPDTNHVWVMTDGSPRRMQLVTVDGYPAGPSLPLLDNFPEPDGTGYLLVSRNDGIYLSRPDGRTTVTTGNLLAAGPTRWLTVECTANHRCQTVVTDRATGLARTLGPSDAADDGTPAPFTPGVISPDGNIAAIMRLMPEGVALHLIDLASGQDHRTAVVLPDAGDGHLVWTPDSHLLFFVDRAGHLGIIDARTTHISELGVGLPAIDQLALRVVP